MIRCIDEVWGEASVRLGWVSVLPVGCPGGRGFLVGSCKERTNKETLGLADVKGELLATFAPPFWVFFFIEAVRRNRGGTGLESKRLLSRLREPTAQPP